jgi:hypothetical protein
MSVHQQISQKVREKLDILEAYRRRDAMREAEIERIAHQCSAGEKFSVHRVNAITEQLNKFANEHHLPSRKLITQQMVVEWINSRY